MRLTFSKRRAFGATKTYRQTRWVQFQRPQGKARICEKRPKRGLEELGGTPSSSKALLALFSLIPGFPCSPWNCPQLVCLKVCLLRLKFSK